MRRVGGRDRFERVAGLELMVRAAVACGDAGRRGVRRADADRGGFADRPAPRGGALAQGSLAASRGELDSARERLAEAVDLFDGVAPGTRPPLRSSSSPRS